MKQDKAVDLFVSKALNYLESSEAFLKKEVPVFIEELLRYEMIEAAVSLVIFVFLGILAFKWALYCKEKAKEEEYSEYEFVMVFAVFFTLGLLFFSTCSALKIVKIKTSPRVYLIEYLKGWGNER